MCHYKLCSSAQVRHVHPQEEHGQRLWEEQSHVLFLPDRRDWLLGRYQQRLQHLQPLQQPERGRQAPV